MPNVSFIVTASQIGLELGLIYEGDWRGSHRRWAAVSPHLPDHCAHDLAPQRGPLMIHKTFMETERGPIARVTFSLPNGIWADTIHLVGDFNDWNYSSHPFQHGREEGWTLAVDLEVGRCYQFRYRRDGEWINDGQADGYVHNRYGSDNFLVVTDPKFKHYADGE